MDVIYINAIAWVGDGYEVHGSSFRLTRDLPYKPDAIVLHPLARGPELSTCMDDTPHNWYFSQARGAVFLRMALAHLPGEPHRPCHGCDLNHVWNRRNLSPQALSRPLSPSCWSTWLRSRCIEVRTASATAHFDDAGRGLLPCPPLDHRPQRNPCPSALPQRRPAAADGPQRRVLRLPAHPGRSHRPGRALHHQERLGDPAASLSAAGPGARPCPCCVGNSPSPSSTVARTPSTWCATASASSPSTGP